MRSFPSDLAITSKTSTALEMLEQALAKHIVPRGAHRGAPHPRRRVQPQAQRSAGQGVGNAGQRQDQLRLSQPDGRRGVGEDAVIFNEYSLIQEQIARNKPDTFYGL